MMIKSVKRKHKLIVLYHQSMIFSVCCFLFSGFFKSQIYTYDAIVYSEDSSTIVNSITITSLKKNPIASETTKYKKRWNSKKYKSNICIKQKKTIKAEKNLVKKECASRDNIPSSTYNKGSDAASATTSTPAKQYSKNVEANYQIGSFLSFYFEKLKIASAYKPNCLLRIHPIRPPPHHSPFQKNIST